MKLAIIAAGESSRMLADGIAVPKPLLPVQGTPILSRIINASLAQGIRDVYCIVNPKFPDLQEYLLNTQFDVECAITVLPMATPSSMHSLFELSPFLLDDRFILSTADAVFDEHEFTQFAQAALHGEDDGLLAITQYIDDERPLCVSMDDTRRILEFSDSADGYEWVTGGLYAFSPKIFQEIDTARTKGISRLRNFQRLLVEKGHVLRGFPFSTIIDVDCASDLEAVQRFFPDLCEEKNAETR